MKDKPAPEPHPGEARFQRETRPNPTSVLCPQTKETKKVSQIQKPGIHAPQTRPLSAFLRGHVKGSWERDSLTWPEKCMGEAQRKKKAPASETPWGDCGVMGIDGHRASANLSPASKQKNRLWPEHQPSGLCRLLPRPHFYDVYNLS